ncbi:hypothetical protein [Microvirga lotononidis]|uniref:Uncharacterized protein n=1 Tax=Microvirga lotononidis TaxID=864069 RepID=I4YMP2_9HYPH|nr:hypothetical protein [Microvirga lotononidis]EIM25234.1 hypothetical protein MicloDRAFT_00059560 [Microvirga lotononidis]WQO29283.1 hypothetical protein U0023_09545 [Microvirga lotononidis]
MAQYHTTIVPPSDRVLLQLFDELAPLLSGAAQIQLNGFSGTVGRENEILERIIDTNASAINYATINGGGIGVSYWANRRSTSISSMEGHSFYSVVQLDVQDNGRPNDGFIADIQIVVNRFLVGNGLLPIRHITNGARGEGDLSHNVALLSAIQASASDQIARVNQFFIDLTDKLDTKNRELEETYRNQASTLERQFAAKEEALKSEREALETLKKDLDDRSNTHARRAIRGELIQTIQGRQRSFTISPETRSLRWPIHVVFIVLLLGSLAGAVWSLYVWGTNPTDAWGAMTVTSAVKTAVFTFGFLTSAGLYISWMNRWFDKHADAQFHTKQFEIDINRATWAVEAALEWKNIQGEQMPDALLTGITKHLFDHPHGETPEYSPLEALASSILGSASNLKMNLNGNEVSLDRKSIKQIKAGEGAN